jgi:ADP-ribose pyrophosphatase YjhB (NUDIX family)/NTP pyrophosphatase (non-canonical NTP hydrolase)
LDENTHSGRWWYKPEADLPVGSFIVQEIHLMFAPFLALAAHLNRRFPAGSQPFQIIARLLEECGELAQQVNQVEKNNPQRAKEEALDPQKLAKTILAIARSLGQIALHYKIEPEIEALAAKGLEAAGHSAPAATATVAHSGSASPPAGEQAGKPRVSAALLRAGYTEVLMVQQKLKSGASYWQLPGGTIQPDELPETAALRALQESTGLSGRIIQQIFTIPYKYGASTTFLVEVAQEALAQHGLDAAEQDAAQKEEAGVAWWPLAGASASPEVKVLQILVPYLP